MANLTQDQVKRTLESLPREVKLAIKNVGVEERIVALGKKYQFQIDETDELYAETMLLIIGLNSAEEFLGNLTSNIGLSPENAKILAYEINETVFLPIRQYLVNNSSTQNTPKPPIQPNSTPRPTFQPTPVQKPIPPKPRTLLEMEPAQPIVAQIPKTEPAVPEINIPKGNPRPWEVAKQQISSNFVGNKLTQNTTVPTQRTQMGLQTNAGQQKTDPYREQPK